MWVPVPISSRGHPEVALHLSLRKKRRILLLDGRLELQYTMSQRGYMIYRGMNSWSNCTATGKLYLEIELFSPKKRSMDYGRPHL
ncbi:uncharacterized protein ARMOST_04541 [Armillaria ostoyae]|uniref:Uncharacterized protein n=1 Tax=Armillaria ostoyae TaxID=47428 RepID=A0A284QXM2_ARMOS|nr:uncharacterized protein ARMOST_04541 [Armillaria ostoyae]